MKLLSLGITSLFFLFISTSSFAQPSGKFKSKIKKYDLEFFLPEGYDNVPLTENTLLPNEYAISKIADDFEIRYQIRPLGKEIKSYKKNLKNPTLKLVHPNYLWKSEIKEKIKSLALSDDMVPEFREFSLEAFSEKFIGDGGGLCFMTVKESANIGYKYAITMIVHRNFVADLHITFLSNDKEKLQDNSLEAFHAMRFVE